MKQFLGGLGIGLSAGVLSGLVGIGGGIIIVPALIYFFGGFAQQLPQLAVRRIFCVVMVLAAAKMWFQK